MFFFSCFFWGLSYKKQYIKRIVLVSFFLYLIIIIKLHKRPVLFLRPFIFYNKIAPHGKNRVARASEQPTAKNEPQVVPFVRISIFSSQTSQACCSQVALQASALIRALAAILRARGVNMWCAKMYPPHKTSSKMFRHAGTGF
jgi:hypothetical protein